MSLCQAWFSGAESQELVSSRAEVPFLEAVKAALRQAVQSYAPYSHCPSGLAIATAGGAVYSGPYLESAAFNPSLGPLQAAVIDAVTDGISYYTEVVIRLVGGLKHVISLSLVHCCIVKALSVKGVNVPQDAVRRYL